ncbi:hypothetical protein NPIL_74601 [Nephila pilipes]|uniref:Uncharacterized protein n=1 Tax=Nephila pilipes TaxID=299642 RepID=A0A8X6MN30_NEPPI|nr:hypothetical protein NPIL_74601 [Nephila pilipes]
MNLTKDTFGFQMKIDKSKETLFCKKKLLSTKTNDRIVGIDVQTAAVYNHPTRSPTIVLHLGQIYGRRGLRRNKQFRNPTENLYGANKSSIPKAWPRSIDLEWRSCRTLSTNPAGGEMFQRGVIEWIYSIFQKAFFCSTKDTDVEETLCSQKRHVLLTGV